ncbi:uncharacterized protein LOC120179133 [Hibiscus syriacus]|uniref:uncharacterized protein LOC120179133 n=1 Tax=Hibiscus syriacus TaxID=106335 RepID=UPI00192209A8|nr:uncharacterized protein LOC120179133 [Hibiscus syriacus]
MYLRCSLKNLRKRDQSMKEYLVQNQAICDSLAACGNPLTKTVDISAILYGLRPKYEHVVVVIASSQLPYNLHGVCSVLLDIEASSLQSGAYGVSGFHDGVHDVYGVYANSNGYGVLTGGSICCGASDDNVVTIAGGFRAWGYGDTALYPDSGATTHLNPDGVKVIHFVPYFGPGKVSVANGMVFQSQSLKGDENVHDYLVAGCSKPDKATIKGSLQSVSNVTFDESMVSSHTVCDDSDSVDSCLVNLHSSSLNTHDVCNIVTSDVELWHCRLGHPSTVVLAQFLRQFSSNGLVGPATLVSNNSCYYLSFLDACTRFTWIYFLTRKPDNVTSFHVMVERQFNCKLKVTQSDCEDTLSVSVADQRIAAKFVYPKLAEPAGSIVAASSQVPHSVGSQGCSGFANQRARSSDSEAQDTTNSETNIHMSSAHGVSAAHGCTAGSDDSPGEVQSKKSKTLNSHPMVTQSRAGVFKPKAFLAEATSLESSMVPSLEPTNVHQAMKYSVWREAVEKELTALSEKDTCELVMLPPDRVLVGFKRLFKIKKNSDGNFARYKAHLVAKGGNISAWSSKKQRVVSRSSTEAEFRSLANAECEAIWVKSLLAELGVHLTSTPVIWCDNTSVIAHSANPVHHAKLKHVEPDLCFVREKVMDGSFHVNYVPAVDQVADVLTKPLSAPFFVRLRNSFV